MSEPKPKRGRPPTIDTETAMQSVVDLFRSKGFAAVSLDDLSHATGLSRPSLYRSFGNKLSMYLGALDAFGAQIEREAAPQLFETDNVQAALTNFFDAMLSIYYREDSLARGCLVFGTAPSAADEPLIQARLRLGIEEVDKMMRSRIKMSAPDADNAQLRIAVEIASNTLIAFSARAKSGTPRHELSDMGANSAKAIASLLALV